jgi:hypothetical protein
MAMTSNRTKALPKKPTQEPEHGSSDLQTTGKSRTGGRFKKGNSGNPNGRRRGTANKVTLAFREAMTVAFDEMGGTAELVTWARANPTEFYKLAVRLVPPGSPIDIGPLEGTLADQAKTVVARISDGTISPEQGSTIMQALSAQARVVEVDELVRRVGELEKHLDKESGV